MRIELVAGEITDQQVDAVASEPDPEDPLTAVPTKRVKPRQ